jgi:hypothetical protein
LQSFVPSSVFGSVAVGPVRVAGGIRATGWPNSDLFLIHASGEGLKHICQVRQAALLLFMVGGPLPPLLRDDVDDVDDPLDEERLISSICCFVCWCMDLAYDDLLVGGGGDAGPDME